MADSLPFDAIKVDGEYDREYKAEDWAWYFAMFLTTGVFPNPSEGLQVVAYSGMEIRVNKGYALINGYGFRNPKSLGVTLDMAEGGQNRVDRVVVRWDLVLRDIYIDVLKGVPSANPAAVALTRNAEIWELALADVYVAKGVTSIQTKDIMDQRFNSSVCGIVKGTIEEIDASVLTKQFNDFFAKYKADILTQYGKYTSDMEGYLNEFLANLNNWYTENTESWANNFITWLENLKQQLDEDTAGNLQNQINSIKTALREISDEEIDAIVAGTYTEDTEGGIEPDVYSRVTSAEIEDVVNNAFEDEGGDES
ncbi:MAG: hypothetical protein K2K46_09560 [Lachnospiraceae bacterium]|nr:hypothetical protein [Lachnospiraceae bacterium]